MVRQERPQTLESRVDALHATTLVRVGDLATDLLLLGQVHKAATQEGRHSTTVRRRLGSKMTPNESWSDVLTFPRRVRRRRRRPRPW